MKFGVVVLSLAGVALAALIVGAVGFGHVLAAVGAIGWAGFSVFCLYTLAVVPILGAGWFFTTPKLSAARLPTFVWGRLLRDSASDVLPFSQVGGLVIGAREVIARGLSAPIVFASTILDLTTELGAQLLYTLFGVASLVLVVTTAAPQYAGVAWIAAGGLLLAAVSGALFVAAQRRGLSIVSFLAKRWFPSAITGAEAVQAEVDRLYRRPARLLMSLSLHVLAWTASGAGAWIALRFIGLDISLVHVLAIESLLYAVRSFAFVVPNAVGVQEGAYALIGPIFGLPAESALALSLLKRARDLVLGVPPLLIWQAVEGGRLLKSRHQPVPAE